MNVLWKWLSFKFQNNANVAILLSLLYLSCIVLLHGWEHFLKLGLLVFFTGMYFYSFKLIVKNNLISILLLCISIIVYSFLGKFQLPVFILVSSILFLNSIVFKKKSIKALNSTREALKSITKADLYTCFFILLIAAFGIVRFDQGYVLSDELHPFYESSIGSSFSNSILHSPDLSFSGKTVKYHFLSTRIPYFISDSLNVPLVYAIYFYMPLLLLVITLVLFYCISFEIEEFRVPLAIVFFLPILTGTSFLALSVIQRTILMTGSYMLATIFMLMALYFFISGRNFLFSLCSVLLVLIKAPYFIVLIAGIGIWLLFNKEFKKIFLVLFPLALIFLLEYKIFFSGAHPHNLWVIFPSYIGPWFFNTGGTLLQLIVGGIMLLAFVFYPSTSILFQRKQKFSANDKLFASIALVGLLSPLLIYEVTELNSLQFLIPALIFISACFYNWYNYRIPGKLRKAAIIIVVLYFSTLTLVTLARQAAIRTLCIAYLPPVEAAYKIYMKKDFTITVNLKKDTEAAYTWLNKKETKGNVLFPVMNDLNYFSRTALSEKQFYLEGFKYKGICMEDDFSKRFVNILNFYKINTSAMSPETQSNLALYTKWNKCDQPPLPMSQMKDNKSVLLYKLSFGKEWSFYNIKNKVEYDVCKESRSMTIRSDVQWTKKFLSRNNITLIVFENGDKPANELLILTRKIYSNNSIQILEVL